MEGATAAGIPFTPAGKARRARRGNGKYLGYSFHLRWFFYFYFFPNEILICVVCHRV